MGEGQSREVMARFRHRQLLQRVSIRMEGEKGLIEFAEKQRAVTPGQSVVFYDGDYVVGGGIIK